MGRQRHALRIWLNPWVWLIPCVAFVCISGYALRANNQEMVRLRDAVFQADKDNGDVEGALQQLRSYVGQHMNTELASGPNAVHPPIQLRYTYERLTQTPVGGNNDSVYSDAQAYCEQNGSQGFSGGNRLSCIEDYVSSHGSGSANKADVPKNLYQFDFATPRWSPDLAGWSVVGAALSGVMLVISLLYRLISRRRH